MLLGLKRDIGSRDVRIRFLTHVVTLSMTSVRVLHEDVLYAILPKCASSIDMWHLLLALDYDVSRMVNLRAFWR